MRFTKKYSDQKEQAAFEVGVRAGMHDLELIKGSIYEMGVDAGLDAAIEFLKDTNHVADSWGVHASAVIEQNQHAILKRKVKK